MRARILKKRSGYRSKCCKAKTVSYFAAKLLQLKYLAFLLFALPVQMGWAQTQSEWRGLGRTGVYNESGLMKQWPEAGPGKLWVAGNIGMGYSSPATGNDFIYVTGRKDTLDYITALDYKGSQVWQVPFGRAWNGSYEDTRTTPTIHDGKVYMISGMGEVACHDGKTGRRIWYRNVYQEFSGKCNLYGVSESPLILGNKVFYTPGGPETSMVALDKGTGDLIWKTRSLGDSAAYVSPLYARHNNQDMIISLMGNILFGVNPANGEILWEFNYLGLKSSIPNPYLKVTNCNTPMYHKGEIFIAKGYNHPSAMFTLNEAGTGVTLKWTNDLLDTHFGGNVLLDGYLYGSNWLNNSSGNWACIDWDTGHNQWEAPMNNKGSIISADGMLYCYDEKKGQLALVKPDPAKFEIVSSFRVQDGTGPHWAHPVIHKGVLYVRHGDRLVAYDIGE
jgi:outer membrane protein assembly factor BamB